MWWSITDKANEKCRVLADKHYTRISVGHPMWTRPGYNMILFYEQANGRSALFCWFRPKWESGIVGTERKDGLRCIECSMFRNETRVRSSHLIVDAISCLLSWEHAKNTEWPDGIITGVSTTKTRSRRSPLNLPGHCFRSAGFVEFEHKSDKSRADLWLKYQGQLPEPRSPEFISGLNTSAFD